MEAIELSGAIHKLQSTPLDELQRQIAAGQLSDDLRALLGQELGAEIERQSRAGHTRGLLGERPLVIILPGIIGSSLANVLGDVGTIWLNPLALLAGKLPALRLDPSGQRDELAAVRIVASGLIPTHYLPIQIYLQTLGGCEVLSFPYDWRRPPDQAVDALRQLVVGQFEQRQRKVHLVGHSMGGLVARNFCLQHPADATRAVAQIVQLGTPNYGSCELIRNLTIGSDTARLAALLNQANAPTDVMRTCPGLYSMLPVPEQLYPQQAPLPYPYTGDLAPYDQAAYGSDGVSARHIRAARAGYKRLGQAGELPVPITIIAGYDLPTCLGVNRVDGDPGFEFDTCTKQDGDGTVPLASATALPGAARLYARGLNHGDLPRYLLIQRAVRALVHGEQPEGLETAPYSTARRGARAAEPAAPEQPRPGTLGQADLDAIAARIRAGQATTEDVQVLAGVW